MENANNYDCIHVFIAPDKKSSTASVIEDVTSILKNLENRTNMKTIHKLRKQLN